MHKIVYVETSDNVFEPRPVEVGAAFGNRITVKKGLEEGDRVVTAGNFMIDSESRMRTPAMTPTMRPATSHAMMGGMIHTDSSDMAGDTAAKATLKTAAATTREAATESTVDPACGMPLSAADVKSSKYAANYRGHKFVFCSANCKKKFEANPEKYTGEKAQTTSSAQAGIGAP
jgi:YHS domain-containing protein